MYTQLSSHLGWNSRRTWVLLDPFPCKHNIPPSFSSPWRAMVKILTKTIFSTHNLKKYKQVDPESHFFYFSDEWSNEAD